MSLVFYIWENIILKKEFMSYIKTAECVQFYWGEENPNKNQFILNIL